MTLDISGITSNKIIVKKITCSKYPYGLRSNKMKGIKPKTRIEKGKRT